MSPATQQLAAVITNIDEQQLAAATPCADTTVAALLDHVDRFSRGFALSARKEMPPMDGPPPAPDAANLGDDWRTRIPGLLGALDAAWRDPGAWEGTTRIGPLDLPADVAALVVIDEVVVHGWDLALATSQPYDVDDALVWAALQFVQGIVGQNPSGSPGLFGPPVPVTEAAPVLHQLIALTGRDPAWRPPAH